METQFPSFNSYACFNDSVTIELPGNMTATATIHQDAWCGAPWENDCHGPVSDFTIRKKRSHELILSNDGRFDRFYDLREAQKIALRDGWGVRVPNTKDQYITPDNCHDHGMTKRQLAAKAAREDFEVLRAWCEDKWYYCGVVVTVHKCGVELGSASLWCIEMNYPGSDNSYLTQVANELLPEAINNANSKLEELTK